MEKEETQEGAASEQDWEDEDTQPGVKRRRNRRAIVNLVIVIVGLVTIVCLVADGVIGSETRETYYVRCEGDPSDNGWSGLVPHRVYANVTSKLSCRLRGGTWGIAQSHYETELCVVDCSERVGPRRL